VRLSSPALAGEAEAPRLWGRLEQWRFGEVLSGVRPVCERALMEKMFGTVWSDLSIRAVDQAAGPSEVANQVRGGAVESARQARGSKKCSACREGVRLCALKGAGDGPRPYLSN
jgi:hypothetical protein